ncbi:HEXXH motif domain-containing protein [Frankia gtarii]|uniref:HEXXH motif domain-containing protein n=1 Tax=Frankia gtarii TaxID=2950102 RepID=UPI0021BE13F6|nr:HEXXH motif domain-containing protein [Frankia gtarii]
MVTHSLTFRHLEILASGVHGEEYVVAIADAEYSLRLAAIRAALDAARTVEGALFLPAVDEAWNLLIRADNRSAEVTRRILSHPHAGTWARTMIRHARGLGPPADLPLWVEVGYLHTLAAAAGIRAGIDFQMVVPTVWGTAVLPTLGHVAISSPQLPESAGTFGVANVVSTCGEVLIHLGNNVIKLPSKLADETPGWQRNRSVQLSAGGADLKLVIEEADPYRELAGARPPRRLNEADFTRWAGLLVEAWNMLAAVDEEATRVLAKVVTTLTPLPESERFIPRSASSGDAFGSLLTSMPDSASQLAAVLVHEFQHLKLGGLMHLVDLYRPTATQLFYAPWRDDPRPLSGLLQGIYAFAGVSWFWRAWRHQVTGLDRQLADFEFALWREQAWLTVTRLRGNADLTELGHCFLDLVGRWIAPWQLEPVPALIAEVVRSSITEHSVGWRLHHLRPDIELVDRLAEAWLAGNVVQLSDTYNPVLDPDPDSAFLESHAVLQRYRLADPASFAELLDQPEKVDEIVAGASAAGVLLVAGRLDEARRIHMGELRNRPDRLDSWIGLTLCLTEPEDLAAKTTMLRAPELVCAVARVVARSTGTSPEPVALAMWTGRQLGLS